MSRDFHVWDGRCKLGELELASSPGPRTTEPREATVMSLLAWERTAS